MTPGVGTNRYSYSFNDPVNLSDSGGNAIDYGGAVGADAAEGVPGSGFGLGDGREDVSGHSAAVFGGTDGSFLSHEYYDVSGNILGSKLAGGNYVSGLGSSVQHDLFSTSEQLNTAPIVLG